MPVILVCQKEEIGKISSRPAPQKVHETPSQPYKLGMVACLCHLSYSGKHQLEDHSLGRLVPNVRPYLYRIFKPVEVTMRRGLR
jgi:hypothetical protein